MNGNNVYRRSDMEHIPGVTPKQLLTNAKRQGHGVLVITNKDYNDGRKAAEKFLDTQWHRAAPRPRKGMKGH